MIVVAVDGSEPSRAALRWAVEAAHLRRTEVTAVHVLAEVSEVVLRTEEVREAEAGAAARLGEVCEAERAATGRDVAVTPRVVRGQPAGALIEAARDAELLVAGRRGLGGFARLVMGSVSMQVAEHGPVPTVVVPAATPVGGGRVVVGVDGSDPASAAATWAAREARLRGVGLCVVHAYPPPGTGSSMDFLTAAPAPDVRPTVEAAAEAAATRLREECGDEVDVEVCVVGAEPAVALLDAVSPEDLLVVGGRGLGGFAGLLLGSTSRQCLAHADCPVAVVRG